MKRLFILIMLIPLICSANSEDIYVETRLGPLAGTLELPDSVKTKAVALIIAGSGPVNRDGNIKGLSGNNNSLKMLAKSLAEKGIASLRYDKRLVGESIKTILTESTLRFEHYINDAENWLTFLSNKFDESLFIIGHSEGALIGIIAANRTPVDGLVSVAGAGRPAAQILNEQLQNRLSKSMMQEVEIFLHDLELGNLVESPPELNAIFRPSVQPYLISWFRYNPSLQIRKLKLPIQIIQGTSDLQVSIEDAKILHSNSQDSQLTIIDGMNHVLKPVSGNLEAQLHSYSEPTLELAPDLVRTIDEFILDVSLQTN